MSFSKTSHSVKRYPFTKTMSNSAKAGTSLGASRILDLAWVVACLFPFDTVREDSFVRRLPLEKKSSFL